MLSCLIVMLALAQVPATDGGATQKPYVIRLKDGSELAGFWQEKKELGSGFVEVVLDTPWAPGKKRIRLDDLKEEPIRELPNATQERKKRALETAGLVELNGTYVPAAEVQLAERARDAAGHRPATGAAPPTQNEQPEIADSPLPDSTSAHPGPFPRWGAYAALALATFVLLALIIKKCFLAG